MAQPVTDGKGKSTGTVRDHYGSLARRGNTEYAAKVKGPGLPATLMPLWGWYQEISEGRSSGGMGPSVLTWGDVLAWQSVTGVTLNGWEVGMLFRMDAAVRAGITPA